MTNWRTPWPLAISDESIAMTLGFDNMHDLPKPSAPHDVAHAVLTARSATALPRHAGGSLEARLLRRLLQGMGNPPIEFHFVWNGERVAADATGPLEHVRIADRSTLRALLRNPHVCFGDAYGTGRIEVDGDLDRFMVALFKIFTPPGGRESLANRAANWWYHRSSNTFAGSRDNIHRHYDLGNDFYSLWLGETMAYTCAYYPVARASLEQAQFAKMEHVCRKLRLSGADSVVEAGCGWGSLTLHMAANYGAKVRAFNISKEQLDFARRRARELGLDGRVEFIEDDYRNIRGSYDVFVSLGMLEHVGPEHYPELGRVARRSLTGEGRGLIHSIGRNRPGSLHPWIERRIFPGAYPPSLGEMMQVFEPSGLSVLDVENMRLHYAQTLHHWLERYDAAIDLIRAKFRDEAFVRMWRLYLAGSIAAFETGTLQLFQVLFTLEENNTIPRSREFMYSK
jgi:cyclopropane-fatty-acyl-phospholipid synthase